MLRNSLKLSRPLHLLLAALTYTLGASIPAYLGNFLQPAIFALGLAGVLLAQLSMSLLAEVFRPHNESLIENETPQQKETLRNNLLYISIAALTVTAFIVYLLYLNKALALSSFLFLLSSFILILSYAIPPIRLLNRGFGEAALAAHIAYIIPSIGFLLQAKENHRLLIFILVPLTALALAYFLILNFQTFSDDQKYQRGTFLRRLTWERAVPLHHSLIVFTYSIFAIAPILGFSVLWPALLTLPFAILQIVLLRNISLGGKPNWTLLTTTALAVFGLTTYFLTLTFWIR
ncbi:MAG: UbiA family prenyltransferase [Anaerolineales bacterium]|nr:UbiA family prenyltransferase [Anaerolineales bacterium]